MQRAARFVNRFLNAVCVFLVAYAYGYMWSELTPSFPTEQVSSEGWI